MHSVLQFGELFALTNVFGVSVAFFACEGFAHVKSEVRQSIALCQLLCFLGGASCTACSVEWTCHVPSPFCKTCLAVYMRLV